MAKHGAQIQSDVLTLLRQCGEPLSAYDVMAKLSDARPKIAPPTVYRALSALVDRGMVHRVRSLNAFVACQGCDQEHASLLSICQDGSAVAEAVAPVALTGEASVVGQYGISEQHHVISAQHRGISAQRHVIEAHGLRQACGAETAAS